MALSSWAQKLSERRFHNCPNRLLLSSTPSTSTNTASTTASTPKPLEVVFAANIGCTQCQERVASAISKIDDVESIVVLVSERKVTVSRSQAAISETPSKRIAAIYNDLSRKASKIAHPSSAD